MEIETALTIKSFVQNNINQLKSVKQTSVADFPDFNADAVLNPKSFPMEFRKLMLIFNCNKSRKIIFWSQSE